MEGSSSGVDELPSPKRERINNGERAIMRPWSDLPTELLQLIADRLGILDLLRFREVCKHWKTASSAATAEVEAAECVETCEPWFLLYGKCPECYLFNKDGEKYSIHLPELEGATCLASNNGWLLIFQEGSLYFFCPFSRAKIDLPKLPDCEDTSNCIASFSSPPNSQDCVVCFLHQNEEHDVDIYVRNLGTKTGWSKYSRACTNGSIKKMICSAYCPADKYFYFADEKKGLVMFSLEEKSVNFYVIVEVSSTRTVDLIPFRFSRNYAAQKDLRQLLRLEEGDLVSTCGTTIFHKAGGHKIIFNEQIKGPSTTDHDQSQQQQQQQQQQLKGVWIHPRFVKVFKNKQGKSQD